MHNTLEKSCQTWANRGQHGSPEQRLAQGALWDPYYSCIAKSWNSASPEAPAQAEEVSTFLRSNGILRPDTTLLDIGAGMGDYALAFAPHCRKITALDRNRDCLEVLRDRATRLSVPNLQIQHEAWETFQPADTYDVSFSSMCPAICDYDELLRMESMTKETCCLIAVMRGSRDKHRHRMMQQLEFVPRGGMATEALQYYEVLYLMGRKPDVKYWTTHQTYEIPAEQFLERYSVYFRIFGISPDASIPYLKGYIAENSTDGIITEESQLNTALIYWDVPK